MLTGEEMARRLNAHDAIRALIKSLEKENCGKTDPMYIYIISTLLEYFCAKTISYTYTLYTYTHTANVHRQAKRSKSKGN